MDLKRKDLLKHDLIVKRLNQRWNSLGVWLYLVNLIIYLLYLFFLTGFALTLPNPQSDTCKTVADNHHSVYLCQTEYSFSNPFPAMQAYYYRPAYVFMHGPVQSVKLDLRMYIPAVKPRPMVH